MEMIPSWAWGVAVIIVATSLSRALVPLMRGMGKSASASDPELSRLGGVLDDMQRRVGDLEERVDFAERLLAKQRDAERLASGGASGPS